MSYSAIGSGSGTGFFNAKYAQPATFNFAEPGLGVTPLGYEPSATIGPTNQFGGCGECSMKLKAAKKMMKRAKQMMHGGRLDITRRIETPHVKLWGGRRKRRRISRSPIWRGPTMGYYL